MHRNRLCALPDLLVTFKEWALGKGGEEGIGGCAAQIFKHRGAPTPIYTRHPLGSHVPYISHFQHVSCSVLHFLQRVAGVSIHDDFLLHLPRRVVNYPINLVNLLVTISLPHKPNHSPVFLQISSSLVVESWSISSV